MDEDAAIAAGWQLFLRHQGDISFAEIVGFIRAQCPSDVGIERIRVEFRHRLREWRGLAPAALPPEGVLEGMGAPLDVSIAA
jgi:hypothetical protein